jgi:hypothetical protein
MNRLGTAIRLIFCLPAMWIMLAVIAMVIAANSEPFVDILLYAVERFSH